MTNTTSEYWEVDGQSLQTMAFNITTWGGSREEPPALRGDNVTVPHAVGSTWQEKIPDSHTITLTMWVIGAEEDGSVPNSGSRADLFKENWKMLRNLLWNPYRQLTLTKRIKHPISGLMVPVTAKAQYVSGLTPQMLGGAAAMFTVDLHLADPFFYGDPEVIDFTLAEETQEFVTLGESRTTDITITFSGGDGMGQLLNPKITNTQASSLWVKYAAVVPTGDVATLSVRSFKASHNPATGATYKAAGNVQNSGNKFWMYLNPGPTDLIFSATSGSGSAQLTYLPRWL